METKEIKIECPEGYEVDKENSSFSKIVFKKITKKKLPKTWKEFCDTHTITDGESYIGIYSETVIQRGEPNSEIRHPNEDRNWLPYKETAESMLALCQLIQLRDCYNEGWKPDWTNDELKFILYFYDGKCTPSATRHMHYVLEFKTRELRDAFYDNFKDLIEIAKPLL